MKLKDRQRIEIVSMDMWNPYQVAVKAVLPQARIVVDKFHVVRMANDTLEKVREDGGYSFEVMRARMLYTTKHKKKAPTAKVSPFYKKNIGYGLPDFEGELNYGVNLSTI